jgi:hypothetical protein
MIKKLLVSGCSYTENATWPGLLFSPASYHVVNKAKSGSGNEYIACSIMQHADINPDFVFVLWSGINRIDMRVPNTEIFDKSITEYASVVLGESKFFLSGHAVDPDKGWLRAYNDVKAQEWPEINSIADWLRLPEEIKSNCLEHKIYFSTHGGVENTAAWCHQYFLTQHLGIDQEYRSERTWQNMLMCFNLLDSLKVPYRFSFIYDIWNSNEFYAHGVAVKNKYYHMIDWRKFIDLPPYQYGIKHDLLSDDQYHLTSTGMHQWATEISSILEKQKDLQHLF